VQYRNITKLFLPDMTKIFASRTQIRYAIPLNSHEVRYLHSGTSLIYFVMKIYSLFLYDTKWHCSPGYFYTCIIINYVPINLVDFWNDHRKDFHHTGPQNTGNTLTYIQEPRWIQINDPVFGEIENTMHGDLCLIMTLFVKYNLQIEIFILTIFC
jgi:hypothetical protein